MTDSMDNAGVRNKKPSNPGSNKGEGNAKSSRRSFLKLGVAGAGVVADSVPSLEWQETVSKARAIFNAAAMSEQGLMSGQGVLENPRARSGTDAPGGTASGQESGR